MRMRGIGIVAIAGLMLAAGSTRASGQAAAVPKSTSDVDPGAVRYFDPGGEFLGRIDETLPFDVPFFLRIPVTETVRSMSGRYVGDTDPVPCADAFRRWRLNVKYAEYGAREVARTEVRQELPITLTRFVNVTEPATLAGRYAELNVAHGLLPNRYYCFEFTRVRDAVDDPAAFRQELADAIDKLLQDNNANLEGSRVEESTYRQLRKDVIAALKSKLDDGERLIIPAGSFLDREAKDEAVPAESRRTFDVVVQAQRNRSRIIRNITTPAADTHSYLLDVLFGPVSPEGGRESVSRGLRILGQTAELSPLPKDLQPVFGDKLEALKAAADLTSLLPAELQRIADGTQSPDLTDETLGTPLEASWKPEDLTVRKANLEKLNGLVDDLWSLAFVLSRDPGLQGLLVRDGEDDPKAALTQLSDSLFQARGELEGVRETVDIFSERLDRRKRRLLEMAEPLAAVIIELILAEGSTTADYEVRANWYLGMDLGVAWAEGIEDLFTYVGTNIYFRPVNKKAPLRWSDFRRGQRMSELMKRVSVTIGLAINDLSRNCRFGDPNDPADCRLFEGVSQENISQGLIDDKAVVVAGGLRLSDFFRVSAGALVFKESEANPLLGGSRLAWAPMLSFSIDWNLRGSLRNRVTQQPFASVESTEKKE